MMNLADPPANPPGPGVEALLGDRASWRKRLLRRILPLVVLGLTAGLVIGQFTRNRRHDLQLQIHLSAAWQSGLTSLEMAATREGEGQPDSVTVFRIDPTHPIGPVLKCELRLQRGRYRMDFTGRLGESPVAVERIIEIGSDATIGLELP